MRRAPGATVLAKALPTHWKTDIIQGEGQIGSGALPDKTIPSICITIQSDAESPVKILKSLRELPTPVIGRIADDKVVLDMRGAEPMEKLLENVSLLQ